MAFDLLRGKTTSRSWARGDSSSVAGDYVADKLAEAAKSRIPWKPVAIVAGALGGLFVLPRLLGSGRREREGVPQHEFDPGLTQTMRVPYESMRTVIHERRR